MPRSHRTEAHPKKFVTVNGKRRLSYLHDEIMRPPEGHVVVFLNRNRLDCRRSNLLVVPKEEARRYRRKQISDKELNRSMMGRAIPLRHLDRGP